ncbi:hypothetical protein OAS89_02155 [Alphaproteobacteria bacterium]|nr:hypothetical protein [Alphaproteobacteria bacterium]
MSLVSFPSLGEDQLNLNLTCTGKLEIYVGSEKVGQSNHIQSIKIIDSYLVDRNRQLLQFNDETIHKMIENDDGKIVYILNINRLNGEIHFFETPKYTGTEFSLFFDGVCEKQKGKKF